MTSRFFSLVAVPIALVGNLLFWSGSAGLLRGSQQFAGVLDVGALALTVAGIVVLLAAVATVAIGSLGAYVVGGAHLVFSLLLHLLPFDFRGGGFSPAFEVMNAVRSASMEVSDGMFFYFPPGVGVVTGTVFLCAALASARRTTDATSRTRVLAGLAGILGVLGIVLAITGGGRLYYAQFVTVRGTDLPGIALLYGGAVLLAVAVLSSRWTSAGMIVAGGVSAIGGVLGLAAPQLLNAGPAAQELGRGLQIFGASGSLLLVGLLLIVGGLAVRFRGRRTAV